MNKRKLAPYDEVVKFHGHSCPGLAMGYRMTQIALEELGDSRSEDEELVAIVENDACGTDAVQYLSGCTFGKGNFIFRDYGKMVYTFLRRNDGKAVRICRNADYREILSQQELSREDKIEHILNDPGGEMFRLEQVNIEVPEYARLFQNIVCDFCGESVMETRIVPVDKKNACIPCSRKISE